MPALSGESWITLGKQEEFQAAQGPAPEAGICMFFHYIGYKFNYQEKDSNLIIETITFQISN